jgi:outer membrane murein-binding lipoprotein Lpp
MSENMKSRLIQAAVTLLSTVVGVAFALGVFSSKVDQNALHIQELQNRVGMIEQTQSAYRAGFAENQEAHRAILRELDQIQLQLKAIQQTASNLTK